MPVQVGLIGKACLHRSERGAPAITQEFHGTPHAGLNEELVRHEAGGPFEQTEQMELARAGHLGQILEAHAALEVGAQERADPLDARPVGVKRW